MKKGKVKQVVDVDAAATTSALLPPPSPVLRHHPRRLASAAIHYRLASAAHRLLPEQHILLKKVRVFFRAFQSRFFKRAQPVFIFLKVIESPETAEQKAPGVCLIADVGFESGRQ